MINSIQQLQIDDLTIKMYQKKDAVLLKDAIDLSLDHLRTFMEWAHLEPKPLVAKEDKIAKWHKEFFENKNYTYGIFRGKKLLGNCGLYKRSEGSVLEIGYWVRADEINKGIATKATIALLQLAFEHININQVEIHLYSNNIASGKIPEKLNFKKMSNYKYEKDDDSAWYTITQEAYILKQENYKRFYNKLSLIY